jgi:hypothetical protein
VSATHYPADAWGGEWVYGGGAPSSALAPSTAHLIQAQWDDTEIPDQRFCHAKSSKTDSQCRAFPRKGTAYCVFHTEAPVDEPDPGADS